VRADGEPGFFRATGGSYVVRTDAGAEFALDAACFLERFRSQLDHIFRDVPPPARRPPLVLIFADEARYRRAVEGSRARGVYVAASRTLYTFLDRARGESDFATFYAKILLHEGAHEALHARCGPLPPWFDEGVASYFQEWDVRLPVDANLERLRSTHYRIEDVRAAFGTERWVPLCRLLALGPAEWDADGYGPRTNLHYAEAASFVSFLLATKSGQRVFSRVYRAVKEREAIENVLTRERVRALEREWEEEIRERIAGVMPPE
jgi:hypothetical protein